MCYEVRLLQAPSFFWLLTILTMVFHQRCSLHHRNWRLEQDTGEDLGKQRNSFWEICIILVLNNINVAITMLGIFYAKINNSTKQCFLNINVFLNNFIKDKELNFN